DGTTTFRVWAPSAASVSVISDLKGWTAGEYPLEPDPSGVWRGTFAGFAAGSIYKYAVESQGGGRTVDKADPFAFAAELPPATGSVITNADDAFSWGDDTWMSGRASRHRFDSAISVYEVHLGSWRYEPGGYVALGHQLADYCVDMGFTHVELLPITEHPFYGSWGYQTTGYFAPTSRYGSPDELRAMIDHLHQAGIGVIVDWVPSHFPVDEHALGFFDGTHLYEHADPKQGFHPDWKSFVFNYDRPEVRSFLLSSAHYWFDQFHIDGLRVDAVASMLYLDYSREDENLGAVEFLQELNRSLYEAFPDALTVAEESTAWPGVTNPTDVDNGLGFGFKWDMGWMHDTLAYMSQDPVHRRFAHDQLTFRSVYQASEHYMLPLSHDEVVHGKGSILAKMPGDRWQQFANLRVLYGYQWTAPGKKLLFMGCEFGAVDEWSHEAELAWPILADEMHAGVQGWVRRLNEIYRTTPALSRVDRDPAGFEWVINDDADQSVLAFLRHAPGEPSVLVVLNNTPVPRDGYEIGSPSAKGWSLLANSDDPGYGGSGKGPAAVTEPVATKSHGKPNTVALDLPPLGTLILQAIQ
ncbi:UNVERIFIED_CONTAM: hypothetical protein GTU68_043578, partial [Idotea baltica]|nr:hypothetical protein [Idotea baltica]